jgi:putative ABC transport system permease protein
MTVAVLLAVLALGAGLSTAFNAAGDPMHVLVLRKGGTSELTSGMTQESFQVIKAYPGIAKASDGQPLVALEMVTVINLPNEESPNGTNLTLRGTSLHGTEIRKLKLAEGRWFESGQREVVVGKSVAKRYPIARVGKQLKFGKGLWTVVGVMDGGPSAINSEIFGEIGQVSSDFNRQDALSSALLQATDEAAVEPLINSLKSDRRLTVDPMTEKAYYDQQTATAAPIQILGLFVCVIMAVGSAFAAMNTMYAMVARRSKEIGTLRVLGFTKGSILLSFFIESVLLCLLGGLLGCLVVLPLNNVTTSVGSFFTFSEVAFNFRVTPAIVGIGLAFSALLGAAGGLLPAREAANKEILTALREV